MFSNKIRMEKNNLIKNIFDLYIGCSCNEGARRILRKKEDYVYNIENINCKILKYYPFEKKYIYIMKN